MIYGMALNASCSIVPRMPWPAFVLFEFRLKLASHFAGFTLSHGCGYDYDSSVDRTNCLASFPLNLESFMQCPG
jgi:hypothetical protein